MHRLLAAFLAITAIIVLGRVFSLGYYPDFSSYYYSPQAMLSHANPYLGGENFFTPFVYPPFVLLFFLPLSFLPFITAEYLWTGISFLCLFLSLMLLGKMKGKAISWTGFVLLASIVCITYFPLKFSLGMGQINILVLLCLVSSIYFLQKKNQNLAGVFLGMSLLLKLFPVLLLFYFLIKKQFRIFLITLLTVVGGIIITMLVFGTQIHGYFFHTVLPDLLGSWKGDYYNQSLAGVLMRQIPDVFLRVILLRIFSIILALITLGVIVYNKKKNMQTLEIGFLITVSLLVNTFSWQHHFVWLLIPFFFVFTYIKEQYLSWRYFVLLGISFTLVAVNIPHPNTVPILFFQSHVFFGALFLWILTLWLLVRKVRPMS